MHHTATLTNAAIGVARCCTLHAHTKAAHVHSRNGEHAKSARPSPPSLAQVGRDADDNNNSTEPKDRVGEQPINLLSDADEDGGGRTA